MDKVLVLLFILLLILLILVAIILLRSKLMVGGHEIEEKTEEFSECLTNYYKALRRKLEREKPENANKTILQLHYTSWCPHCVRMMVPWNQVKYELMEKRHEMYNKLIIIEHDEDLCKSSGITSVPTIIKYDGKKICKYRGGADMEKLKRWITHDL